MKQLSHIPANPEIMVAGDHHFTEHVLMKLAGWGINEETIMSCMMANASYCLCSEDGTERLVNAKIMILKSKSIEHGHVLKALVDGIWNLLHGFLNGANVVMLA